jgi:hypothetical protein
MGGIDIDMRHIDNDDDWLIVNVQDPVNFSLLTSSLTPLPRQQQEVVRELQEKQNQNKPTYHANTTTIISLSADHYQHPHQHHIRQYHVISPDDSSVSSNSSSNRSNNPVTPNTQSNETPVDFPDTVEVTLPISNVYQWQLLRAKRKLVRAASGVR